jgi:hypothetical protein
VKQITYAGLDFVTGDDIANALLELVAKLGTTNSTMNVEIPAYDASSKKVSVVDFVIGPSSEIVAVPIDGTGYPALEEQDAVQELNQRAARVGVASHPIPEEKTSIASFDEPIESPDV